MRRSSDLSPHSFEAVTVTPVVSGAEGVERHVANLDGAALEALEILDIDPAVFSTP